MDEFHDSLCSFTPHLYEFTNQKWFGKKFITHEKNKIQYQQKFISLV